jgi:hypothetical protein
MSRNYQFFLIEQEFLSIFRDEMKGGQMKKTHIVLILIILTGGIMNMRAEGTAPKAGGIVFLKTNDLNTIKGFYHDEIGCDIWLDQGGCIIFRYGNLLIGFCQAEEADREGIITFFFEKKEAVDAYYLKLKHLAGSPPKENKKYRIYHFFARDPEGRNLEFQHFLHPVDWSY